MEDRTYPRGTLVGREIIIRESARGSSLNSFVGQEGIIVAPVEERNSPVVVEWKVEWKRFNPRLPPTTDVPYYFMKSKIVKPQDMANDTKRHVPMYQSAYNNISFNPFDIDFPDWLTLSTDFTHFVPCPDGDGVVRYWGLEPTVNPVDRFGTMILQRKSASSTHDYTAAGPPAKQVATMLAKEKMSKIKDAKATRDICCNLSFILRIDLVGVEPVVYGTVRVSGSMSLRTFADKTLEAVMGWGRGYHSYIFTDPTDGALFGQQKSERGIDGELMLFAHGCDFVDDERVRIGDLLSKPGEYLLFTYDLGVRWEHTITVLAVNDPPSGDEKHCVCLEGAGACPPEDSNGLSKNDPALMLSHFNPTNSVLTTDTLFTEKNGNVLYHEAINEGGTLHDTNHPDYHESHRDAMSSVNIKGMNWSSSSSSISSSQNNLFDWRRFDLISTNRRLSDALQNHGAGNHRTSSSSVLYSNLTLS